MSDPLLLRLFGQNDCAHAGFYRELRRYLPRAARLLDLGCGDNSRLARFRTLRREVWGADLSRHPALAHPAWFRLIEPDGRLPFPSQYFDLVASCWVLEHVKEPGVFFGELHRVLRPGGIFVALTPNLGHYVTWVIRIAQLLPHRLVRVLVNQLYGREEHDTFAAYYKLNTVRSIQRTAQKCGMELVNYRRFASPDYFQFFKATRRAAVALDWALSQVHPGLGHIYTVITLHKTAESQSVSLGPQRQAA